MKRQYGMTIILPVDNIYMTQWVSFTGGWIEVWTPLVLEATECEPTLKTHRKLSETNGELITHI